MFGDLTIQKVSDVFIEVLKRELREQGHHLTGALESSIKAVLSSSGRRQFTEIQAAEYLEELDEGVSASQIPRTEAYILAMVEYAKKRLGASHAEANQIGWMIAKKHAKEGMPTAASAVWSNTGERTGVINEASKNAGFEAEQEFGDEIEKEIDSLILTSFDKITF